MNRTLRAYLELVRLPNLFTAMADPLAGFLLAGGDFQRVGTWVPLCLTSLFSYAAGTSLNDACDAKLDAVERPTRPIPSGRIGRTRALFFVGVLLTTAICIAVYVSTLCGVLAIALASAIVAYDAICKATRFAPAVMGVCRSLSLLLGAAGAGWPAEKMPAAYWAAGLLWLYVTSITVFARREAQRGHRRRLSFGFMGVLTAAMGCALFGMLSPRPIEATVFGVVCVGVVAAVGVRALRSAEPSEIQHAVKWFVINIIVFDACMATTQSGLAGGLLVATMLVPTIAVGRVFRMT